MMRISSRLNLYEMTLDRNKIWYFLDSASNCLQINCDQHIHSLALSKQRNSNKCISFFQVKFSSSISMARHSQGSTNQSCKRSSVKNFLWTSSNINVFGQLDQKTVDPWSQHIIDYSNDCKTTKITWSKTIEWNLPFGTFSPACVLSHRVSWIENLKSLNMTSDKTKAV